MTLRRLFNLLIALTVTAGLLSSPFAAPSLAKTSGDPAHAAVAAEMHAMDGDMHVMSGTPCCPDEGQANDCASCPLMALCMLSTSIPLPADASALATPEALHRTFSARDDARVPGLAGHPPDHPPRSQV